MSEKQELTQEEKIDYIYRYIKKEERNAMIRRIIKWIFWLVIIGYFYVMIFVLLPNMISSIIPTVDISKIKNSIFWNTQNTEILQEGSQEGDTSPFDKVRQMLENNY